jgi:D-alanine-D-alanine ligase
MRVTVLYGGPGAEREVSLVSGKAVIEGLRSMGHEVFGSDVSPENLSGLNHPADVIFPVLHGQFGESGELQEILERRKLAFVGSGSAASRLGMNKANTKIAWENAGLPTPRWLYVNADTHEPGTAPEGLFAPCVVKAVDSGSSIDVYICRTMDAAREACAKVVGTHGRALVEQFIKGTELTVGILEEKPLAPIRITTTRDFYDYDAKYKGQTTEYHFDLNLPADVVENVRDLARQAHGVVGARDLSRIDVMLDEQHRPFLLEINTLPGFTPRSLLPKAAGQAGIEFGPLVDRLVKLAYDRRQSLS